MPWPFGKPRPREWRRSRRIPRTARRNALVVVIVAFAVSVLFFAQGPVTRLAYASLGVLVVGILLKLPVAPDQAD